jgi:hypothetical protein
VVVTAKNIQNGIKHIKINDWSQYQAYKNTKPLTIVYGFNKQKHQNKNDDVKNND